MSRRVLALLLFVRLHFVERVECELSILGAHVQSVDALDYSLSLYLLSRRFHAFLSPLRVLRLPSRCDRITLSARS